MFEYLGVSSAKRGPGKCPADHRVHIQSAHDAIAKLAQTCLPSTKAHADDTYLHRLQHIHDKLVEVGADCDGAKVREAIESASHKAATLRKVFAQPRGLGRDALPSACADKATARLQLCHQTPQFARSGHDLHRRR